MTSVKATVLAGYYVAKMLPKFLWLPVEVRKHLRRATDAFEDQLRQSGLDASVARELAKTYNEANKQVISKFTSPRPWAQSQEIAQP